MEEDDESYPRMRRIDVRINQGLRLFDLIARNRGRLGVAGLAVWGVLQINPGYQEWKKANNVNLFWNDLAVVAAGYVTGSGRHRSDAYQREKQRQLQGR